ncbi:peptide ABC transporter ATP-binding protein oppD fragment 1 [Helicobacter acinonychis]|nr:peptide ABC transporter ATP-binding protein oppD fragment 1 [Helicobacter acinonychis]
MLLSVLVFIGEVLFEKTNLLQGSEAFMQDLRGNAIVYIAQDPLSSLNPLHKIGKQMSEAYFCTAKTLLKQEVLNAMKQVQLAETNAKGCVSLWALLTHPNCSFAMNLPPP